jgi:hypothetical protein
MSTREEMRILIQALIAASIIEVLFLLGFFFLQGANAQGIWIPSPFQLVYLYIHAIGFAIADKLGGGIVCCAITGTVQFFLIIYVGLVIRDWRKRRHTT